MATLESTIESMLKKVGVKGFKHHQQLIIHCLMKNRIVSVYFCRLNERKPSDIIKIIHFYGTVTSFSTIFRENLKN